MLEVISATKALHHILDNPGRYAFHLGAGVSVEAGVATAQEICETIRARALERGDAGPNPTKRQITAWANATLQWKDPSRRYVSCIQAEYPIEPQRIDAFRDMLRSRGPAFCHHAVALLMSQPEPYVKRTCLTTNFDHLLESAFIQQGISDFQAIRSDDECRFHRDDNRSYVIKLHGDIDTDNILNTLSETERISEVMQIKAASVVRDAGLVVIGTAAYERSIQSLFLDLRADTKNEGTLSYGLLWGVYMGTEKPKPGSMTPQELTKRVRARAQQQVSREILEMMDRETRKLFCFFPVWGAGEFMLDLVLETKKPALIAVARRWLDHEMRLRHVFAEAGLTDDAVKRHLASLREARRVIEQEKQRRTARSSEVEEFLTAPARNGAAELRVMYGDITSRSLMAADWLGSGRRAVVSPEDTFVSAGGGVAYQLAVNAGPEAILNELTKFAPIPHGGIAVTSGGSLPVHYVFHAAALEIAPNGKYLVDASDVSAVMAEVLATASALGVSVVLLPLIGTGVAPLQPLQSLEALLEGIGSWVGSSDGPDERSPVTVCVVIYQEKHLARADARDAVERVLGSTFDTAGAKVQASAA